MNIEVCAVADPEEVSAITAGLGQHASVAGIEPRNAQPLFAMLHDQHGQLIAGLCAVTVWGWLHIKELWVSENARGTGIGTSLMVAAESEAHKRGCHHSLLDTFDFQARASYEKLGYKTFGELAHFPRGHCRYFLSKELLPNNATQALREDARE